VHARLGEWDLPLFEVSAAAAAAGPGPCPSIKYAFTSSSPQSARPPARRWARENREDDVSALRDVVKMAGDFEKGRKDSDVRAASSLYGPISDGGIVGLRDMFLFLASGVNLDALSDVLRIREARALVRATGISVLRTMIDTMEATDAKAALLQYTTSALSRVVPGDAVGGGGHNVLLWCHPLSVAVSMVVLVSECNRSSCLSLLAAGLRKTRGATAALDSLREDFAALDAIGFSKFELRNHHTFHNLSGCRTEHLDAITVETSVLRDSLCRHLGSAVPVDVVLSCLTVLATEVRCGGFACALVREIGALLLLIARTAAG
jgi:hypothetical protein